MSFYVMHTISSTDKRIIYCLFKFQKFLNFIIEFAQNSETFRSLKIIFKGILWKSLKSKILLKFYLQRYHWIPEYQRNSRTFRHLEIIFREFFEKLRKVKSMKIISSKTSLNFREIQWLLDIWEWFSENSLKVFEKWEIMKILF